MKRVFLSLIAVCVMFVSTSGCASVPIKEKMVTGLQVSETLLAQAQDTERFLCSPETSPGVPIQSCQGATATAAGLTTEKHRAISAALATAFAAQGQAAIAMQAWRSGDPVPTTLPALAQAVKEALQVVRQLTVTAEVSSMLSRLQQLLDQTDQLLALFTK